MSIILTNLDSPEQISFDLNEKITELSQSTLKKFEMLPDELQRIGGYYHLTVPSQITSIGERAFIQSISLVEIALPNHIQEIGNHSFWRCSSLSKMILPKNLEKIGVQAFQGCSSLTTVDVQDGITSIGDYAFSECRRLFEFTMPDSVTVVGEGLFYGSTSLTSVRLSNSMTSIGDSFFTNCISLRTLYLPNNIENIAENAFSGCFSLEKVYMKNPNKKVFNGKSLFQFFWMHNPSLLVNFFYENRKKIIYSALPQDLIDNIKEQLGDKFDLKAEIDEKLVLKEFLNKLEIFGAFYFSQNQSLINYFVNQIDNIEYLENLITQYHNSTGIRQIANNYLLVMLNKLKILREINPMSFSNKIARENEGLHDLPRFLSYKDKQNLMNVCNAKKAQLGKKSIS